MIPKFLVLHAPSHKTFSLDAAFNPHMRTGMGNKEEEKKNYYLPEANKSKALLYQSLQPAKESLIESQNFYFVSSLHLVV